MIIKGFISFSFRILAKTYFTFPVLALDLVGRVMCLNPNAWAGCDCSGLETISGIAQTWTKSFFKQIIKATVLTSQLKMNFKLCSFSQTLWRLNLINITFRFACWKSNVHGLESQWKIVFTYKVATFDEVAAQLTSKLFLTTLFWYVCLSSWRRWVFLYSGTYRLQITADGPYHGWTSST